MEHITLMSFNITMTSLLFQQAEVTIFIFPTGWYTVFEIEFSHLGRKAETSIWCARMISCLLAVRIISFERNLKAKPCMGTMPLLPFEILGQYLVLFDLILYIPVNNFSVMSDGSFWVEPVLN